LSGLLVEKAAGVDGATSAGTTPLMLALQFAPPEQARRIIERGANVNAKDKDGWTPLMFALRYSQAENARLLIEKGASLEDRNPDGWTPLSFALRYGETDIAALLIEKGVEFNHKTLGGWEPLLTALRNGQAENARTLILKGANANAKTDDNWTALMFAISYDQPENARLLLSKGADASVRNKDGKTALAMAREKNYFDLIRLLTPAGAATASAAPPAQPARAEAAPARVETASARVPRILGDALAWPAWATVASAEDCVAGLTGVMQCKATIEATTGKVEAYNYFEKTMKKAGWRFDKGSHAPSESGSLAGQTYWGYLGFVRHPSDGGFVGTTFEFQSDSSLTGDKTRLTITYQSFPKKLKSVTYPQVVATYPPGAETCKTTIDVIGVGSDGSWRTSGMVDYRNFAPQLQCLGTRVTLKVPLTLGSINYSVGTKLTVDKDRNWISVQSWE
jgi:ankyrin repeat protein